MNFLTLQALLMSFLVQRNILDVYLKKKVTETLQSNPDKYCKHKRFTLMCTFTKDYDMIIGFIRKNVDEKRGGKWKIVAYFSKKN